jgi:hypothetical protein
MHPPLPHAESVTRLAALLRAANSARPVFLLGAGASFSSGVPLADKCVSLLARRIYAEQVLKGARYPHQIKTTEWRRWLTDQAWYISDPIRFSENFPLVIEHLLRPQEYRRQTLIDLMQPSDELGRGYEHLSGLVLRGLVGTILTTNFDPCLPIAVGKLRPHLPSISEINRGPLDFGEFDLYARAQIVWLHGKAEGYTDKNLLNELQQIEPNLKAKLRPLLEDSPLIVVGYRGAEPSVMQDLLIGSAQQCRKFRKGIFWCSLPNEPLHPNVGELERTLGSNFIRLEIAGFDELLADLSDELKDEDRYLLRTSAFPAKDSSPFDEQPVHDASIGEIDLDLALVTLIEYCTNLNRPAVTRDTLLPLLRELGLVVTVDDSERPTVGCLLLFGNTTIERFPHAVVTTTVAGKKRVNFAGNLLAQRRELLRWLDTEDVNPTLRVKRVSVHENRRAYAQRALVELVVNLLVHRDYERREPATIELQPGIAIEFRNSGGLTPELTKRVNLDADGRFKAVPNCTDARNRSLCDIFLGIRAMEWRGTGLPDVEQLAKRSGGEAVFRTTDGERFEARITQLPSTGGIVGVARDDRPTGVYILNVLPAASMPGTITFAHVTGEASKARASSLTCVLRDNELWTFATPDVLQKELGTELSDISTMPLLALETAIDKSRVISWLLRRHFERHLNKFLEQGLVLEEDGRKRAYFRGDGIGRSRMLRYDSPSRRNIRREVVKQRAEDERAWFENEGFGYEITRLDRQWAIRIKPFYMFTGKDAVTPLPSFARTSRATRRMKFDRNKNVEDDLTFWARFLSEGQPTLSIGQDTTRDLLFSANFLTVEVPTEGGGSDEN